MKVEDIPFNMKYSYGDDLREVPEDSEQMRKGLEWLQDKLQEVDENSPKVAAGVMTQISNFARTMGDFELAKDMLDSSLRIFEEQKMSQAVFAARLRMAVLFQHTQNYTKAGEIYSKALSLTRQSSNPQMKKYLDFILQHYGKMKFEQKLYAEALEFFMEAYELRLVKGDLELISSTELAINKTKEKLGS